MLSAERMTVERKVANLRIYHESSAKRKASLPAVAKLTVEAAAIHHYVHAKYGGPQHAGPTAADEEHHVHLQALAPPSAEGTLRLHDPSATVEELQRELARERQLRQALEARLQLQKARPQGSRSVHVASKMHDPPTCICAVM